MMSYTPAGNALSVKLAYNNVELDVSTLLADSWAPEFFRVTVVSGPKSEPCRAMTVGNSLTWSLPVVGSTWVTVSPIVAALTVTETPGGAPAPSSPCRSMYQTPGVVAGRMRLAGPSEPDACSLDAFSVGNAPLLREARRSTSGALTVMFSSTLVPSLTST